jgi:hypothetical protein
MEKAACVVKKSDSRQRGEVAAGKAPGSFQNRVTDAIRKTADRHGRGVCLPLPSNLLMQAALHHQLAVAKGELGEPCSGPAFIALTPSGLECRNPVADGVIAAAPVHRCIWQRSNHRVGGLPGKTRQHLCGSNFDVKLVAQVHCLPGVDGGLIKSRFALWIIDLWMQSHGGYGLNRTRKAQVLAEAKHGFHGAIGIGRKVHARDQLTAV